MSASEQQITVSIKRKWTKRQFTFALWIGYTLVCLRLCSFDRVGTFIAEHGFSFNVV